MKKMNIIYWVATILAMLMGASPAFMYFTNQKFVDTFSHLGFPAYFRVELGIAKIIGMLVLLIPAFPARVKEWAYAGFGIVFISAVVAHGVTDGPSVAFFPMLPLIFLVVSYIYFTKQEKLKSI